MFPLSDEIKAIPHSPTLWANELVWKKRANGDTVYHMGFGESPFPVPERLEKALAAYAGRKEYMPAAGHPDVLEAIRSYYKPLLGNYMDHCDLIIAPGSKLILFALQAAIKGDLIIPAPSWVSYAPQARLLKQQVTTFPPDKDDQGAHGYRITAELLDKAISNARKNGQTPTKIILNTPNNPSGMTIADADMADIATLCEQENLFIISDEIYGLLSFDGCYRSFSQYAPTHTAVSTGLSKHLSLGGWRFGVGMIPKAATGLYDALCRYISETWSCAPAPVQLAAAEAYKNHPDIEKHIKDCTAIHAAMNTYIAKSFREIGIKCPPPQGAFYNYPDFSPYREALHAKGIRTSDDLHKILLESYHVATLPGTAFGAAPDILTLRISGCDYDGQKVLKAYQEGASLTADFIHIYAPQIPAALGQMEKFVTDIS